MAKKIYPERSDISRLKTDMKNVYAKYMLRQCLNERNETKVRIIFEENLNEPKQSKTNLYEPNLT